ncbi:hypothetical protein [Turicimonas muris]|uniref:hypothetical protein n=1 Tax=Turicimonas muris TaxID=1796652 RepID=UPI0023F168FA|nr:hypothetical protein [Turicimonas muris]
MVNLIKSGAVIAALFFAYWLGLTNGKNSEELKHARLQVYELTKAVQDYETKQKDWSVALAELRVAESMARDDAERMRQRVDSLEKRAKTADARIAVRCLRLEQESREALQEARGIIEYCGKALQ